MIVVCIEKWWATANLAEIQALKYLQCETIGILQFLDSSLTSNPCAYRHQYHTDELTTDDRRNRQVRRIRQPRLILICQRGNTDVARGRRIVGWTWQDHLENCALGLLFYS